MEKTKTIDITVRRLMSPVTEYKFSYEIDSKAIFRDRTTELHTPDTLDCPRAYRVLTGVHVSGYHLTIRPRGPSDQRVWPKTEYDLSGNPDTYTRIQGKNVYPKIIYNGYVSRKRPRRLYGPDLTYVCKRTFFFLTEQTIWLHTCGI